MTKPLRIGWKRLQHSLSFTDKEMEVLKELSTGKSEPAIAATLGISKHTVHAYTRRFHIVLKVRSRAELLAYLHNVDAKLRRKK